MATWEDVRSISLALPEASEELGGHGALPTWKVKGKSFAWERPLRTRDLEELGDAAPTGPVLGVHVPDEGAKHALIGDDPAVYFTTSHFNGYPAVLVRLDEIEPDELAELLTEAWFVRAPKRLAKEHAAMLSRAPGSGPPGDR
jgi:hypothetical protein